MTLFELQADTARLGFLPDVGDQSTFLACANRALLRVNALRPLQKTARLLHLTEENLLQEWDAVTVLTAPMSVRARAGARAYAFYGIGEGTLRITAQLPEKGEEILVSERALTGEHFYEGGIYLDATPISPQAEVCLTFEPNGILQILSIALYAMEMPARRECSTVDTKWLDYDLRVLCGDLLTCEGVSAIGGRQYRRGEIRNGARQFFADAVVRDAAALGITMPNAHTVRIPTDRPGIYTLPYLAAPPPLTGADEQEIGLSADLAALLPLACAAELFYEEDPDKSAFYLENFRSQAAQITACAPVSDLRVVNGNGW